MAISFLLRLAGVASLLSVQTLALVLHDSLPGVPAGWSEKDTPTDSSQITLQVSLSQQNIHKLEETLAAVSTPGSPEYGYVLTELTPA